MGIVALAGARSQTGKSTLAVLLAHALAQRGVRTLLIDAAQKKDALAWSGKKAALSMPTLTTVAALPDGGATVKTLAPSFDTVVIDLTSDPLAQRRLISVADVVVVPWRAGTQRPSYEKVDHARHLMTQWDPDRAVPRASPDDRMLCDPLLDDPAWCNVLVHGLGADALTVGRRSFDVVSNAVQAALRGEPEQTAKVDMRAFLEGMSTFVGRLQQSLIDLSSDDVQLTSTRAAIRESADSARRLLGLHFKAGETFMVRDADRFFACATTARRVLDGADALLHAMESNDQHTAQVPAIGPLLNDIQTLVKELTALRS